MGIQTHFDKFHNKIKLGREDEAYKKARERDDSIKKGVTSAFAEAGYPVVKDFIQGSLRTHTGIVPISGDDYDIDRALVINDEMAPENPVTPKKKALDVLEDRGFKNAKIKKPCVTADYASDNVHIDFIIYKRSGNQHYLAVGKENSDENNREWSAADPHGLTDWINDDSCYGGDDAEVILAQFRRLVRYLKRWRDAQFSETLAEKVFSIGLTVMVKERLLWSLQHRGRPTGLAGAKRDRGDDFGRGLLYRRGDRTVPGPRTSSSATLARHFRRFEPLIPEHSSTTSSSGSRRSSLRPRD